MSEETAPVTETTETVEHAPNHARGERGKGAVARQLSHIEAREAQAWVTKTTAAQVG